ncbi:MAG: 1,4-dihydroxy-6-naphthoate synthase [Pirellulaceae bacterium]|nr:1,4-dihydroxy-6-naphthoate synthase [Pirellulaceae bacterium]
MSIDRKIELGISTCPNDTFAFHGLLTGKVDPRGLGFDVRLTDVQELNDDLLEGKYDVAKASFHAALMLADDTVILPSGSALGFGNGPLLLSRHDQKVPADFSPARPPVILCPGATTTATLLYQLFYPGPADIRQVVFSDIMPALKNGEADFGVCIHEGRFTWQEQGLFCVSDLGAVWHQETQQPLPLGGILARRRLGSDVIWRAQDAIHDSIQYGLKNPDEALSTMRQYAAEMDDQVLMAHVDLYVNQQTVFMEATGRKSLSLLSQMANRLDSQSKNRFHPLEVLEA